MFKRISLAAVLAFSMAAIQAEAQDRLDPDRMPWQWSGYYAAIFAGASTGDVDMAPIHSTGIGSLDYSGFSFGIGGGYRHQFDNNIVAGVGLAIPIYSDDGSAVDTGFAYSGGYSAHPQFAYMVSGQLGYAVGRFMPFVQAGVGQAIVKADVAQGGCCVPTPISQTRTHLLTTIGAGVAAKVTPNQNIRFQYQYLHASKEDYTNALNAGLPDNTFGWHGHSFFLTYEWQFPVR